MCNFIPGQVVAVGRRWQISDLGCGFPGDAEPFRPLVSDPPPPHGRKSPLLDFGSVTVKVPPGLEMHAISRLSARLGASIEKHEAAVDLNHRLALSAPAEPHPATPRLGAFADQEAQALRRMLEGMSPRLQDAKVAILDSGISPGFAGRPVAYLDYANQGWLTPNAQPQDRPLHGTRVATILDRCLPPGVRLSMGRLSTDPNALTVLTVIRALADIVVREQPDVVNLSVAIGDDVLVCQNCHHVVPLAGFVSALLPLVVRLAGEGESGTVTVMAAGNAGQVSNTRWLTREVGKLLVAYAEDRQRRRAKYSNGPLDPADVFCAGAFGGDDEGPDAEGVFADGLRGSSYAAPFVSAGALCGKRHWRDGAADEQIGEITRQVIENARLGRFQPL